MVGAFCKKQKPVVLSSGTALALVTWAGRRRCSICAALISFSLTSAVLAQAPQPMTAEQIGKFRAKLAEYDAAQAEYRKLADRCWAFVKAKRAARIAKRHAHKPVTLDDDVLTQPPDDSGPKKPIDPSSTRRVVPIVADFRQHAAEQFSFVPERPQSEIALKKAYAAMASAAGLTTGHERSPVADATMSCQNCWWRPMRSWTASASSRARRIWRRVLGGGDEREGG